MASNIACACVTLVGFTGYLHYWNWTAYCRI